MPSQFPYLPKYIYILISQIQSKYIFVLLCVCYLYHGFTANSPTLTYLLPLSFSTYLFLFSLSSFSSFNSSTPLCHSDQSFALLLFRNTFFSNLKRGGKYSSATQDALSCRLISSIFSIRCLFQSFFILLDL